MDHDVKILCVDDEANVLKSLQRLFMDEEYELFTAESGREALEILKKEAPVQVVISDYRMPEMNGVDFLKQVYGQWPETIRIVLSGYADTASVVEAINEGQIYKFIPKPWNDDELKVTISKAVDVYFLKQENTSLSKDLQDANEELKELNENLESLVRERTSELLFQNKVLTHAQCILDSLPVGVLGMDMNGMIAQCNRKGAEYLKKSSASLMGMGAGDVLPGEIIGFVKKVYEKKACSDHIQLGGNKYKVMGSIMNDSESQEGVIVVLDGEDDDL